ncbi:hypothetical protein CDD83_3832 [Cordyceps sp. RAO-2017]|nr:hypothetical protein CDD83_3832 [Cordyceps sp. RAO-2017]
MSEAAHRQLAGLIRNMTVEDITSLYGFQFRYDNALLPDATENQALVLALAPYGDVQVVTERALEYANELLMACNACWPTVLGVGEGRFWDQVSECMFNYISITLSASQIRSFAIELVCANERWAILKALNGPPLPRDAPETVPETVLQGAAQRLRERMVNFQRLAAAERPRAAKPFRGVPLSRAEKAQVSRYSWGAILRKNASLRLVREVGNSVRYDRVSLRGKENWREHVDVACVSWRP